MLPDMNAEELATLVKPRIRRCLGCGRQVVTALYTDRWGVTARIILPYNHGQCRHRFTIDLRWARRHWRRD